MAQLAHELVDAAAAWAPSATALRHGAERISYAGLAGAIAAFAGALQAHGVAPGDRVAVRLPASPPAVAALLGASGAGCASVPLDPLQSAAVCIAILRDCGARVLVLDAAGLDLLGQQLGDCPALRAIVVHGGGEARGCPLPVFAWESFLASAVQACDAARAGSPLAALMYSPFPVQPEGAPRGRWRCRTAISSPAPRPPRAAWPSSRATGSSPRCPSTATTA